MILNGRSSPHRQQRYGTPQLNEDSPPFVEETLYRGQIQIDRKTFSLTLKENPRGRFLRIVEHSGEYYQSVVIPASGLEDFYKVLADIVEIDREFLP
jgi:hypothetical protein